MSNQWFRFKKFTIHQDRCAMKVGTDGVILGAWVNVRGMHSALDIGTGTGLLALMLAQRQKKLKVTALEIDPAATLQALENVAESPFSSQVQVIHSDFRTFQSEDSVKFDILICNPPYFSASLQPAQTERAIARHSETLEISDIFKRAEELLNANGEINVVVPASREEEVVKSAAVMGLHVTRILRVIPVPGKEAARTCLCFSWEKLMLKEESLVIEEGPRHMYTKEYRELTKDFYL